MKMFLAMLAAATVPADAAPWVVISQEPICALGTVFKGDVRFRLEYHPRTDSYHLLLGSDRWVEATDGTHVNVSIGTVEGARVYQGRFVRQDASMPAAVYVPLSTVRDRVRRIDPVEQPNIYIEQLLADRSSLVVAVDGRTIISERAVGSRAALGKLARCSNKFVPAGKTGATFRLQRSGDY